MIAVLGDQMMLTVKSRTVRLTRCASVTTEITKAGINSVQLQIIASEPWVLSKDGGAILPFLNLILRDQPLPCLLPSL
jgi:hypothetical protein